MRYIILCIVLFLAGCSSQNFMYMKDGSVHSRLSQKELSQGDPIFIRIFKEEMVLEIWMQKDDVFVPFTAYPICYYSGPLGPKKKQGDKVSPEGFYTINKRSLNPYSQYHKSFNLGFPNQYDRFKGYTGNYLMVHGDCVSIGCYAMTDEQMDEIYYLVERALNNKQSSINVHVFPFKMTSQRLAREKNSEHYSFWLELKEGYDAFEKSKKNININVKNGVYSVN